MMKRLLIVALLLSLIATPLVALASNISGARYYGVIQISNADVATTNVATTANISTTNLINGNYLNSSANNCVMRTSSGADVPFMPGYTTDNYPWCIWVPSIGDYGYQSDILYTANSTGGEIRYFPDTGGMTTPDNDATLELGDNFTIEQRGWVTTTFTDNYSERNLVYKEAAFITYVSGTENITSAILEWVSPTAAAGATWTDHAKTYDNLTATYAYDEVPASSESGWITITRAAVTSDRFRHWVSVQDVLVITDIDIEAELDGTWTNVYTGDTWTEDNWETREFGAIYSLTGVRFKFENTHGATDSNAYVHEIDFLSYDTQVTATGVSSGEYTVTTVLEVGDTDLCNGGTATASEGVASKAFDNSLPSDWRSDNPPPQWVKYDFGTSNEKVIKKYTLASSQYYFSTKAPTNWILSGSNDDVSWDVLDTVTGEGGWEQYEVRTFSFSNDTAYRYYSANITSTSDNSSIRLGELEFIGNELAIYIDTEEEGRTLADGTSVPDNGNEWTFIENDVMPYMEYQKIWIDGVLRQHIVWEYDDEFTDLSGNSNPATPSFRTASSDPDVSAELISFQPVSEAKAPDYVLGEAPAFIDPGITGNVTGTFTTTPGTGTFPLANVIAEIAAATDTPEQLPLLIIAVFVILAASLTVSATMRRYGSGSILVKVLVISAVMGIFIALGNFAIDFWMLVVFLIIGISIAFMSKQLGWS